jgi:hypothetical protein
MSPNTCPPSPRSVHPSGGRNLSAQESLFHESEPSAEQHRASGDVEPPDLGKLKALPMRFRIGDNANAFLGGFRSWADDKRVPPNVPPRRAGVEPRSVGDLGHPER